MYLIHFVQLSPQCRVIIFLGHNDYNGADKKNSLYVVLYALPVQNNDNLQYNNKTTGFAKWYDIQRALCLDCIEVVCTLSQNTELQHSQYRILFS